jgi:hypothetical protein
MNCHSEEEKLDREEHVSGRTGAMTTEERIEAITVSARESRQEKKRKKIRKVSPRFELGLSDSESEVITITPRNLFTD